MTAHGDRFAADDDVPIPYMARTRAYYEAISYDVPYRWAHHLSALFQPLTKPLHESLVAIVTHGCAVRSGQRRSGPRRGP